MIPEHSALGYLTETPFSWYRPALKHLTQEIASDISSLHSNLQVGWCVKGCNPIWGAYILKEDQA